MYDITIIWDLHLHTRTWEAPVALASISHYDSPLIPVKSQGELDRGPDSNRELRLYFWMSVLAMAQVKAGGAQAELQRS